MSDHARLVGALRSILAAALTAGFGSGVVSSSGQGAAAPVAPPHAERFHGLVAKPDSAHLEVRPSSGGRPSLMTIDPRLAARLRLPSGVSFEVLNKEQRTPAGLLPAVRLSDARGLYALVESVCERPVLSTEDRRGLAVRAVATEKTRLYETPCASVYAVPAEFTISGRRMKLQPYETRKITINGSVYSLSVGKSQVVVPRPCQAVFEGNRSQVDYVLVRGE